MTVIEINYSWKYIYQLIINHNNFITILYHFRYESETKIYLFSLFKIDLQHSLKMRS